MDAILSATIQEHTPWEQPMLFFLSDGTAVVNLAEAVGDDIRIPYNALDQPDCIHNCMDTLTASPVE